MAGITQIGAAGCSTRGGAVRLRESRGLWRGWLIPLAIVSTVSAMAQPVESAQSVQRGLGLWLTDYSRPYLDRAFALLTEHAEIAYAQFEDPFDGPDSIVRNRILHQLLDRAREAGLKTYAALEPLDGERKALRLPPGWAGAAAPDFADAAWREAYRASVRRIAERHRPDYLNLAVEANLYYHYRPGDFPNFRSLYHQLRDDVRAISPDTKVFCSFVYATLLGEYPRGVKPQWDLLGEAGLEMDVLGISSYPMFLNDPYDPARVPADYFAPLRTQARVPVFFAELGWYSSPEVSPESSPARQAEFVRRLPDLLQGVNVEGLCWISLADLRDLPQLAPLKKQWPQFFSLGLMDADLRPKPALDAWAGLPHRPHAPASTTRGSGIALDALAGFGGTRSAEVRQAGSESRLVWSYTFDRQSPAVLSLLWFSPPSTASGLKLRLRSETEADLTAVIEQGGGKYEQPVPVTAGEWLSVNLPWTGFAPQAGSNGTVDPAKAEQFTLVDLSAFKGRKGGNRILVDLIEYINPSAEDVQR